METAEHFAHVLSFRYTEKLTFPLRKAKLSYMLDAERKLSKTELGRCAAFDATKADLEAQGFSYQPLIISVLVANLGALAIALPVDIVFGAIFFAAHPIGAVSVSLGGIGLFLVLFVALAVVHELIHGLVWAAFAKGHRKSVSFGFIVQYLTPYCTCSEPLPRYAYVIGALAPTVVLGILPVLVSLATGSLAWFLIGALMILGGGGDMAIVVKMLRFRPTGNEVLYLDHPYECGLVAFVK